MDRKLSELSGTLRGLSDEAQAQIRRSDTVDSRLWEFRHQLEEEFRQKNAELAAQMQELSSSCRVGLTSSDEANKRLAQQVKRLEVQVQELDTSTALVNLQTRIESVEIGYQREAENSKAAYEEVIATCTAATVRASEATAPEDPRIWQFEHHLTDLMQKVESLFLEAHGDRGWDARFQEHEVRLAGIRSKLDSQESNLLTADDRFRQDTEQRLDQLRKTVQDTANRQVEGNERLEVLLRSNEGRDGSIDEVRMRLQSIQAEVVVQGTVQAQLTSPTAPETTRIDVLTDNLQALAAQVQGQESFVLILRDSMRELDTIINAGNLDQRETTLDAQRRFAKLDGDMKSLYEQVIVQGISGSPTQSLVGRGDLTQSLVDGNAVMALRQIGMRLDKLERERSSAIVSPREGSSMSTSSRCESRLLTLPAVCPVLIASLNRQKCWQFLQDS